MKPASQDCLAVIPARRGSKRVPRKNVRSMAGRPLISYTIAAAVGSGLFKRVVVTTDSPEIAAIAEECGADVPYMRDAGISDDITPVSAATVDVLERLDPSDQHFAAVCQLMANCPLRTAADIVASYEQFLETGADSQLSLTRYTFQNPWWAMRAGPGMTLEPLFEERLSQRSQDLPELYCPTGAVWWAKPAALRREGTFHIPGRTGWEIEWAHGIDIDTEDDWMLAEALMTSASAHRDGEAR